MSTHLRLSLALVVLSACTTAGDDLRRAERAFAEARYEDAEVWLVELEPELASFQPAQRARFYYLAGMSAQRMGKRREARHALSLCREELALHALSFPPSWQANLEAALQEP